MSPVQWEKKETRFRCDMEGKGKISDRACAVDDNIHIYLSVTGSWHGFDDPEEPGKAGKDLTGGREGPERMLAAA